MNQHNSSTSRFSKIFAVVLINLLVGAALILHSPDAHAIVVYQWRGFQSGWNFRCLDFDLNSNRNGGIAQQWDCNNQTNQRWYPRGYPPNNYPVDLQSGWNGRCLDFDLNTNYNGGRVQQWDCNGQLNQRFQFVQYRNAYGYTWYAVQSLWNGRCLDFDLNSNRNGGKVQQWDCNGWSNQSYRL